MTTHIVNISGGKDSAACYLLAIERGRPFRAVFADTGNEHEETHAFVGTLSDKTGGPPVETVRADFTERLRKRRAELVEKWSRPAKNNNGEMLPPVSRKRIEEAKKLLHPTGNPFVDAMLHEGMMPSPMSRFCTSRLKIRPIHTEIVRPALTRSNVVNWIGKRRGESPSRRNTPKILRTRDHETGRTIVLFHPLVDWSEQDCFDLHRKHGLEPNRLYARGMTRVGCLPCIMCRKGELAQISRLWPEHIKRIRQWEILIAKVSRRGEAAFFNGKKIGRRGEYVPIHDVVDWSRGGAGQTEMDFEEDAEDPCEAGYCE